MLSSIIPHVSGRSALPVIDDAVKLKQELDLMDSLLDMVGLIFHSLSASRYELAEIN
jgi:hypothetical protein